MKLKYPFLCFFMILTCQLLYAVPQEQKSDKISWAANYTEALANAKKQSKFVVLFFTGSDWCGWCNKLEKEALDTSEFAQAISDKLIFVKLDFPMRSKQPPQIAADNAKIQKKFSVKSFPTVIIIDHEENSMGVTGYRAGGGKQYAQHLLKMVTDYTSYQQQMKRAEANRLTGKELKRLYQKANEFGSEKDANFLIEVGIKSDLSHFFLTEKYRLLVNQDKTNDPNTLALKQKLLESDPDNQHLTHYQVAVIDFESINEKTESKKLSPEMAVAPLVGYIGKFGKNDRENLWRLNMVISQVYLDKNHFEQALQYAEESYRSAPSSIQPDIAMAIQNIQKKLGSTSPQ